MTKAAEDLVEPGMMLALQHGRADDLHRRKARGRDPIRKRALAPKGSGLFCVLSWLWGFGGRTVQSVGHTVKIRASVFPKRAKVIDFLWVKCWIRSTLSRGAPSTPPRPPVHAYIQENPWGTSALI